MIASMPLLSDTSVEPLSYPVEIRFIQKVQEEREKCRDYLKYKKLKWVPSKGVSHE